MNNNNKISIELEKELEYAKRICNLYGKCGEGISHVNSHHISHFGLNRLNEQKV